MSQIRGRFGGPHACAAHRWQGKLRPLPPGSKLTPTTNQNFVGSLRYRLRRPAENRQTQKVNVSGRSPEFNYVFGSCVWSSFNLSSRPTRTRSNLNRLPVETFTSPFLCFLPLEHFGQGCFTQSPHPGNFLKSCGYLVPHCRQVTTSVFYIKLWVLVKHGADGGDRTHFLLFTRQVLDH